MALIADTIFNNSLNYNYSIGIIILGTLSYTFQIYFDFSGYSDMAIGLGKMFGFNFLENFNYPYMSLSISDFWKRWHISLTTFFREYLYIPLGGNRVSKKRWILNMTIVWILTGFWHGAAWTFILWGLYYLVILLVERTLLNKYLDKFPKFIRFVLTFIVINFGWLIFRVESLNNLYNILKMPFQNQNYGIKDCLSEFPEIIPCLPFLVIAFIFSLDIMKRIENEFSENLTYNIFKKISLLVAIVLSIALLVSTNYNPFIYFRF